MPTAFLEDRRGRGGRSERDYALLADFDLRTRQALFDAEGVAYKTARELRRRYPDWRERRERSLFLRGKFDEPTPTSDDRPSYQFVGRHVARAWTEMYGGAIKTWRQRLTRARRYVATPEDWARDLDWASDSEGLGLTPEGLRLLFGCDWEELEDRLEAFRQARSLDFWLSERDLVDLMASAPALSVPIQPPPPRRRHPTSRMLREDSW